MFLQPTNAPRVISTLTSSNYLCDALRLQQEVQVAVYKKQKLLFLAKCKLPCSIVNDWNL